MWSAVSSLWFVVCCVWCVRLVSCGCGLWSLVHDLLFVACGLCEDVCGVCVC